MSLSRPQLQNPAARFYQWSGSRGQLEYYDKEKQERIPVKLPFKFIVLDELHTITGYSDSDQSGFWSNEVTKTTNDFTVRTKRGIKFVGPYRDPKTGNVQIGSGATQGAKYAKSVYIAQRLNDEWVLANIKMVGVSLSSWIDLNQKHRTEGNITALTGSTDGSKGATKFKIPTFEYGGAPEGDILQIATDLDAELQKYLDAYLTAPKFDDSAEVIEDSFNTDDGKATPEQVADFEKRKAEKLADKQEDEEIKDMPHDTFDESEPINLDDIPF
jgi:hypothetical protein